MRSRCARFTAALPSAAVLATAALALAAAAIGPAGRPLAAAEPQAGHQHAQPTQQASAATQQPSPAQQPSAGAPAAAPTSGSGADAAAAAAEMETAMKLAQPGAQHQRLGTFAGHWKVTGKSWMGHGQPPIDFNGSVESSLLLGGRYLQSVHKGSFVGMPFEGRAIDGYDNAKHEYFSTWIDNFGTGVMLFRGTCDDPCKVLTETAEGLDPMSGKMMTTKEVTTLLDPDTYRFEMYMVGATQDGKDFKVMELIAKREK